MGAAEVHWYLVGLALSVRSRGCLNLAGAAPKFCREREEVERSE